MPTMPVDPRRAAPLGPRRGARRRDRHGRGRRFDLIPPHLPGYRTRRERFDEIVAAAIAAATERYPRKLAHVQVIVEDVQSVDPAPWESAQVSLGRSHPGSRDTPPQIIVHRRAIETRCTDTEEIELLVRQVVADQLGALIGVDGQEIDPDAWD